MTTQLESAIDELITVLTRFKEAFKDKKREDAKKQSSQKEDDLIPSIPLQNQNVTFEDVRSLMTKKRAEGKSEKLQKLLQNKYGASRLSNIDSVHYPQLFKDAEEL